MLKKVRILNYGPFKDEEINFEDNLNPIHIIGMNDVGKTALLNAIASMSLGLNKKFLWEDNSSKVQSTFYFSKEYYIANIIKKFKKNDIKIFEGIIIFETSKTEFEKNIHFLFSNKEIKSWTYNFIAKINENLSQNNSLNSNDLSDNLLSDKIKKIDRKERKTTKDKKAKDMLELFLEFKELVYFWKKVFIRMMPANSTGHFDFIKSSYTISDSTNEMGDKITSDWVDIREILCAFFSFEKIETLEKIVNSDLSDDEKRTKFNLYEVEMAEKINKFFLNNFPSQNQELQFNFRIDANNKIYLTVRDSSSNNFTSLDKRSDGFKWFLKLFILLENNFRNSAIIIDEPEKFLHAAAQKELVKLFEKIKKEKNIQILYATHSIFMLTNDIYPSLKIVVKGKEKSQIYNNIGKFINSNAKKIKDVLLPISMSLGIDIFELAKLKKIKKILIVEGEGDLYSIKLSSFLLTQNFNFFILPMQGKDNPYGISIIKLLDIDFRILFDGDIKNKKNRATKFNIKKEKILNIKDFFEKNEIIEPEDMLDNTTRKKYRLIDKENHKIGWKKLYEDVLLNKYTLNENEIDTLKNYWEKINEKIN